MVKDKISLDAVELMVSIDFKNRCATDRMTYNMDLREINERKMGLRELGQVADTLTIYCDKQEEMGISPIWIKESIETIDDYTEMEWKRIHKEEEGINSRLETLNKQIKEFDEKEKKK